MTPIKQRYDGDVQRKDCFLCCAAMATGFTYEIAADLVGDLYELFGTDGKGPQGQHCDEILARLGALRGFDYRVLFMMPEYATSGFLRNVLWGRRAMLQVVSKNFVGEHHIVFWDGKDFHDPSNLRQWKWDEVEPIYIWLFDEANKRL